MERHDTQRRNYFVAGPWNHGGWNGNGGKLGAIDFGGDTAAYYREEIFQPWFDHWLRGQDPWKLAEATVFETGANQWKEYEAWPPKQGVEARRLYFHEGRREARLRCFWTAATRITPRCLWTARQSTNPAAS